MSTRETVPSLSEAPTEMEMVAGAVKLAPFDGVAMLTVGGLFGGGGGGGVPPPVWSAVYGAVRRCLFDTSRQSPLQSSRKRRARSIVAIAASGWPSAGMRASTVPSGSSTSLL